MILFRANGQAVSLLENSELHRLVEVRFSRVLGQVRRTRIASSSPREISTGGPDPVVSHGRVEICTPSSLPSRDGFAPNYCRRFSQIFGQRDILTKGNGHLPLLSRGVCPQLLRARHLVVRWKAALAIRAGACEAVALNEMGMGRPCWRVVSRHPSQPTWKYTAEKD